MATKHRETNRESIQRCNRAITERLNVSLRVYKSLKALTQLAAVAVGLVAIQNGAEPLTVYGLVAAILVGPEYAETIIAGGDTGSD
jgi:hypothetical protein